MLHAKSILAVAVVLLAGCGDENQNVMQRTGESVGQAVTDFTSGVGAGVDKGLEVSVETSEQAAARGLSQTVAKKLGIDRKGVSVYLLNKEPLQAQLVMKALDGTGQEIGRAVVDADYDADEAQYVEFIFDNQVDLHHIAKYLLDVRDKKPPTEDRQPPAESSKNPADLPDSADDASNESVPADSSADER